MMSSTSTSSPSLRSLLQRSLSSASKAFTLNGTSEEDLVTSALHDLHIVQSGISALFSPNETVEDISTRDLLYLSVPYVCASVHDRVRTSTSTSTGNGGWGDRIDVISRSIKHLKTFLSLLDDYEIIPTDQAALYDPNRNVADPATRRELKIKQYQKEKELRSRIETLRKRRNQNSALELSNDFDQIASLLPSPEEEEDDSSTDEILRDTTLLLLRLFHAQAQTQLQSMHQEMELLRMAPPPSNSSTSTDARQERKEEQDQMWRVDAPIRRDGRGEVLLDDSGKPLRPFTILPSTTGTLGAVDRARIAAQVFRPDHNLPTMSVDEYLEIERSRGKFISGGGPASESAPTSSEQLALDAEMDGTREGEDKGEEQRWKDERWARFADENEKGAGNRMNRG